MGNWEFYDDEEEMDIYESEKEPSFSFYDFKKWLGKQKRENRKTIGDSVADKQEVGKDTLKEQFKEKMRKRAEEKIEKKLKDKKRNKNG